MRNHQPRVVVIGAGMAGLAAAHRLRGADVDVRILEKSSRPGGRVLTEDIGGMRVDTGAQILANFYTNTLELIRHYGLANDLLRIQGSSAIARKGQLVELHLDPLAVFTPLLTVKSKLKLLKTLVPLFEHWQELDVHAFAGAVALDEQSIADYVHSGLGDEVLEYLVEPPLSGIFYYTPQQTSQALLFLLLKAAMGLRLYTIRGGLDRLPHAMASQLPISYSAEVTGVAPSGDGGYHVSAQIDGAEQHIEAQAVICATPANTALALCQDLQPSQRVFMERVTYSSSLVLSIKVSERINTDLYGFFCADQETDYLAAAVIESGKLHTASQEGDVICLFCSNNGAHTLDAAGAEALGELLWADVKRTGFDRKVVGARAAPVIRRWPMAVPVFDVGYFKRLAQFEQTETQAGALSFAGDFVGGPFIEGAVTSGMRAADQVLARLSTARDLNG